MVCSFCCWRGNLLRSVSLGIFLPVSARFSAQGPFLWPNAQAFSAHFPSQTCVTSSQFYVRSPWAFLGGLLSFTFGGGVPWNVAMHMSVPTMFIGLDMHHGGDPWVMSFLDCENLTFCPPRLAGRYLSQGHTLGEVLRGVAETAAQRGLTPTLTCGLRTLF